MSIIFWFVFGVICLTVLIWAYRHVEISRAQRLMPPLHSGLYTGQNGPLPSISLLVAGKDEEANIEGCLTSLAAQEYPELEIIAINDRSKDATPGIMDRLAAWHGRLASMHIAELRTGWLGKNNAMREGVARSKGEWLCFTDADCVMTSKRAVEVSMRYAIERNVDFLSVLPAHETRGFWERVIQPACSGILMIWFKPPKVNDPSKKTAYANGAFMLMRRTCYNTIGGHEAVKTEFNEDIHMARLAKERGQRLLIVTNDDLYTVRMYNTFAQMWNGWSRIFFGCFGTLRRLLLSLTVVTFFSLLPWVALAVSSVIAATGQAAAERTADGRLPWQAMFWASAASCLVQLSVMVRFYTLNKTPGWYGLFYPLGAVVSFGTLINAIRRLQKRSTITWRGTTYSANAPA